MSKPPRPNKRLPASVKAFHAPGFQLLSTLRDYFLLSIFIWFFSSSSLIHFLLCLISPPGKQQGVAVLLHLSAHPSSFISSPWFEQSLLYIPHLTAFVPVAFLSPRSFRCQVKQRCHHFIPSSQFMSCLICLKTYNPDWCSLLDQTHSFACQAGIHTKVHTWAVKKLASSVPSVDLFVFACLLHYRCVRVHSWSILHGEVWWMRKLWPRR